ncbi:DNA (cytosine-5-)-methyltransferase [Arcobacter sp. 15-2]|uniref:DNA cytosine methyltransferase n=1 Tax=Arcobacter sp. 15-2 TaxID=3374109 RepID=UPI00399CEFA5
MKKRLVSLFSGAGGMDLGFEGNFETMKEYLNLDKNHHWIEKDMGKKVLLKETPFTTVFANDILKPAAAAWIPFFRDRGHDSEKIFHSDSIIDIVKKYREGQFRFPSNVDIVTGGFPCQDFSVAGNRQGLKSTKSHDGGLASETTIASAENRGQLYMWLKEVIEITKPKVFYAENVKGLSSMSDVKRIIENDFKSIDGDGYFVLPTQILNAADYGIPQKRERVIFIGFNKKYLKKEVLELFVKNDINDNINPYPLATHFNPLLKNNFGKQLLKPYSTCENAFYDLQEPNIDSDLAQQTYSKAKFCKGYQGNIEIKLNHIAPVIRAEHHGNIEFRRLSQENGGKYLKELELMEERRLTVRECARLQTFPDNYVFVRKRKKNEPYSLSGSGAYKIIGNAVPPLLSYALAKQLENIWDNIFIDNI